MSYEDDQDDIAEQEREIYRLEQENRELKSRIEKILDRIVMRGEGSGPCDKLSEDIRLIARGEGT